MTFVASVQIPNLPIAIARRDNRAPAGRPLVLYMVELHRAAVYAASTDANVETGMPLHRARVRCPQATYLLAEPDRDRQLVAELAHLLGIFSPRVAVDAWAPHAALALDLGKLSVQQVMRAATDFNQRIRTELRLSPAIGVASNPLVARHAARRAGADVAVIVLPGQEAAFLAPQAIKTLGLDDVLLERLKGLGLRTVGDLARVPLDALQAQFGGVGLRLSQLARGVDTAPIPATSDAPTIISRMRHFTGPLLDRTVLERVIADLAARVAALLLTDGRAANKLTLTLALDDGEPVILEHHLAEATSDGALLNAALLALSRSAVVESGVTSITVTASGLVPIVVAQLELFAPATGQAQRLRAVLDRLESRFADSLLRAQLVDPEALLPERRIHLEPR
jgi:DNA polymerase-4